MALLGGRLSRVDGHADVCVALLLLLVLLGGMLKQLQHARVFGVAGGGRPTATIVFAQRRSLRLHRGRVAEEEEGREGRVGGELMGGWEEGSRAGWLARSR